MIYISEVLTNPIGNDARGEWIEIGNDGSKAIVLSGWKVSTKSGKTAVLSGEIPPGGFRVFSRGKTGLVFKNEDEEVLLSNTSGVLVARAVLPGKTVEGKSFNYRDGLFFAGSPTPGKPNAFQELVILARAYESGVPVNPPPKGVFVGALIGALVLCAGGLLFIVKTHAALHDILFKGNQESRA